MPTTIEVAHANGIKIPVVAWECSQAVGVPFWATCAFLEQESAGGANVFGHDPGWYCGAGLVTLTKYRAYKAGRAAHNPQGVGPMQLTWPGFQDAADALGGCWIPRHNVTQGLRILRGFIDSGDTWHEAARRYNGSETYADQIDAKIARWKQLLAGATPPGGHMPTGERYEIQGWYGAHYSDGTPIQVTKGIAQALDRARVLLGYDEELTIEQGCLHDGSKSGGTHSGLDVFDLAYWDHANKARVLAGIGVIPFVRDYNWDGRGGGAHIHCILRGSRGLSPQAAAQVPDWDKHLDGLAYHRPYQGPWFPVKSFIWHEHYGEEKPDQPPAKPPVKLPLFWNAQHASGDKIRALEALVAAHPNMPQVRADLEAERSRWRYYAAFNK
jgi:hypothetical protein